MAGEPNVMVGKPPKDEDLRRICREAGLTAADLRHAKLLAGLHPNLFPVVKAEEQPGRTGDHPEAGTLRPQLQAHANLTSRHFAAQDFNQAFALLVRQSGVQHAPEKLVHRPDFSPFLWVQLPERVLQDKLVEFSKGGGRWPPWFHGEMLLGLRGDRGGGVADNSAVARQH